MVTSDWTEGGVNSGEQVMQDICADSSNTNVFNTVAVARHDTGNVHCRHQNIQQLVHTVDRTPQYYCELDSQTVHKQTECSIICRLLIYIAQ